ncbi:MAG: hypothetical protein J0G29_05925 [Alphaproteobacteria bacterium]|nr:hypothetical protein [Alphaproteobacteria bacterium]
MITIDSKLQELDRIILEDKTIILYDPAFPKKEFGPFANIEAFNNDGEKIWTVELPVFNDIYYFIKMEGELLRANSYGYICLINPESGKIISKTFVK